MFMTIRVPVTPCVPVSRPTLSQGEKTWPDIPCRC